MRILLLFLPIGLMAQTATTQTATAPAKRATSTSTATGTAAHRAVRRPAAAPAKPKGVTLTTDDQKTIYALGLSIYRSLGSFNLSPDELAIVQQALSDAHAGKPAEEINVWGPKIQPFAQARAAQLAQKAKAESATTLEKAAAETGAVKTDSGMVYKEVQPGTGASPAATDTVKVHYRGTLPDGTEFDSSYKRNEPAEFPLDHVIKCWTEGVQKMKVGGKAILTCPANLAYGDEGRPGIPPGAALTFQVELLGITPAAGTAPLATPNPQH